MLCYNISTEVPLTHSFALGDTPDIFQRLLDPDIRLAIWSRPNPCRLDAFPEYAQPAPDELSCLPDWLGEDIRRLGRLYRAISESDWQARLETATERTCPAFHEDALRLRFLVTYRGPGTEWIVDGKGDRIECVPTGAVAAVKGRAWPSDARILHRSAKASVRRPRWVLAMDAVNPV